MKGFAFKKNVDKGAIIFYREGGGASVCLTEHLSTIIQEGREGAFWNTWTLDLDFGHGNAGLWTDIGGSKVAS